MRNRRAASLIVVRRIVGKENGAQLEQRGAPGAEGPIAGGGVEQPGKDGGPRIGYPRR